MNRVRFMNNVGFTSIYGRILPLVYFPRSEESDTSGPKLFPQKLQVSVFR